MVDIKPYCTLTKRLVYQGIEDAYDWLCKDGFKGINGGHTSLRVFVFVIPSEQRGDITILPFMCVLLVFHFTGTGVIGSDVPWLECPACNALTWVITVTE